MKLRTFFLFLLGFILSMLISATVCYTVGLRNDPDAAEIGVTQLKSCGGQIKNLFK